MYICICAPPYLTVQYIHALAGVSTMDQSSQLLGAALRVPAAYPNSVDVAFASITRYDANNNVISDAVMTFEFETGVHNAVPKHPPGNKASIWGGVTNPVFCFFSTFFLILQRLCLYFFPRRIFLSGK